MAIVSLNNETQQSFQWNREVTTADDDILTNTLKAHNVLLRDGGEKSITIQDLNKPPFSYISNDVLCNLRDELYKSGIYNERQHEYDENIIMTNDFDRLWKMAQTYSCKLHPSSFRPFTLMSIHSPFNVIYSILNYVSSTIVIDHHSIVDFAIDVITNLKSLISYRPGLCVTLHHILINNSSSIKSLDSLVLLIYKFLDLSLIKDSYFEDCLPVHSCMEYVINPLIENKQITSALSIYLYLIKSSKDITSQHHLSTIQRFFTSIHDTLKFENRHEEPNDSDELLSVIDTTVRNLEILCQNLPVHVLKSVVQSCKFKLSWFVQIRLHCYLENSATSPNNVIRLQFNSVAKIIGNTSSSDESINDYEQMIILCATCPYIPSELQTYEQQHDMQDFDKEIGKWIAALTRQLHLLTPNEIYRLVTKDRLCMILQTLLFSKTTCSPCSDDCNICDCSCSHIFSLKVCLQSVTLLLCTPHELESRVTVNSSARICRAICLVITNLFNSIMRASRIRYLRLLFGFVVGDWEGCEGYGSCVDIVTMAILECVDYVQKFENPNDIKSYVSMISEMNENHGKPTEIFKTALNIISK